MSVEYVRAWSRDKLELHGLLFEPSSRTHTVVLHIHGTAGNFYENRFIDAIAGQVVSAGFSFLTGDNRGRDYISDFLKSGNGDLASVKIGSAFEVFEECLFDIGGWIDFLVNRGYSSVILEGHSTGALKVTLYQSVTQDRRVAGIILMSPSDDIALQRKSLGGRFEESLKVAEAMVKEGRGKEFVPGWVYDFPICASTYLDMYGPASKIALFRFSDPHSDFPELGMIKCPILAFFGTENEALVGDPGKALERIKASARSSVSCETATVAGSRHNYRGHETQVASLVSGWLRKISDNLL